MRVNIVRWVVNRKIEGFVGDIWLMVLMQMNTWKCGLMEFFEFKRR